MVALCIEGHVAVLSFTAFAILALYQVRIICMDYWSYKYCLAVMGSAVCIIFFIPYSDISRRSALIGSVFGASLFLCTYVSLPWQWFFIYGVALSFFHFSEYFMTAIYKPESLSTDSFLLNHSPEYQIAAIASWLEFGLEAYFFPALKSYAFVSWLGVCLILIGEVIRKGAMYTAKKSFNHIVQDQHNDDHVLVTHGLYRFMRHPSYVGWFWWSIGTQLLLCNPFCLISYAVAAWKFFSERVRYEEFNLISFFGVDYVDYIQRVPSGIPFVYGLEKEVAALAMRK